MKAAFLSGVWRKAASVPGMVAILALLSLPFSYLRNWVLSHQPDGGSLLGTYAQINIVNQAIATFLVFGGPSLYNHFLPKLASARERGAFIARNFRITAIGMAAALLAVAFIPGLGNFAFNDVPSSSATWMLIALAICSPLCATSIGAIGGLSGFRYLALLDLIALMVPLVALAFIANHFAPATRYFEVTGSLLILWILASSLFGLLKIVRPQVEFQGPAPEPPAGFWTFGLSVQLTAAVSFVYTYLDQFIVSKYFSLATLGEYFLIIQLAQLVTFLPQKLAQVALHEFSSKTNQADTRAAYAKASEISIWAVSLMAIMVIALAPYLTGIFGKSVSAESPQSLRYLAAGASIGAIGALNSMLILSQGLSKIFVSNNLFLIAVQTALNLALIPAMGLRGAIIGRIAAIVVGQTGLSLIIRFKIFRDFRIPALFWWLQLAIWALVLLPESLWWVRGLLILCVLAKGALRFAGNRNRSHES